MPNVGSPSEIQTGTPLSPEAAQGSLLTATTLYNPHYMMRDVKSILNHRSMLCPI